MFFAAYSKQKVFRKHTFIKFYNTEYTTTVCCSAQASTILQHNLELFHPSSLHHLSVDSAKITKMAPKNQLTAKFQAMTQ